jgi:hypothetical protein
MGRIDAKKPATVRSDVLDRFEASDRPHNKLLLSSFERGHGRRAIERLWYSLPDEDQRDHKAQREHHAVDDPREVDPIIADIARILPAEPTHEAGGSREASSGTHHLQENDDGHLREVRQTRLAGIGLPISICDE